MSVHGRTPLARLLALEAIYQVPQACPACRNYPTRITYCDPISDVMWYASMPESGCPACGHEPIMEYRIMLPERDDMEGMLL